MKKRAIGVVLLIIGLGLSIYMNYLFRDKDEIKNKNMKIGK